MAQGTIDVQELADYRLSSAVFERFVDASRRIADITRQDESFANAPLFTQDIALSGDAVAAARELTSRLQSHGRLAAALRSAKITPREYSTVAIALVAARQAHGFLKSGTLRRVPQGAPAGNVEFVARNEAHVLATLLLLGVED